MKKRNPTRKENLDPRWLDRAIELDQTDLVRALAVPGHAAANEMLSKLFKRAFSKPGDNYELIGVLDTMARVRHPEATDATIDVIKKNAKKKSAYHSYWLGRLIPRLPKDEALSKLEALLPKLPEKAIDPLLDSIAELKYAD